jgi:hypothetical protein
MIYEKCQDDGVDDVVAEVLPRTVVDVQQTSDPALAAGAWEFLEICAPLVAERLKKQQVLSLATKLHPISKPSSSGKMLIRESVRQVM